MNSDLLNYNPNIVLNSLELVNFMCHDHLIVRFNKPFTCIGGRNGSGKSAIMISLGILFGLRSGSLDKGNSLKNFIKTGEVFFIVRCVLNNTKRFMFDTFGDVIILEKKVTIKSSSFTVSTKEKKTIFNKLEDLEYLLDFYNLKLDNPMNFLTQEMAKRFLSSSDPKVLYNLFLKGTEIFDIREINEEYKRNVDVMKEKIALIESELNKITGKIEDESRRIDILNNVEELKRQVEECQAEIKWSKVYKVKEEADKLLNSIDKITEEIKIKQDLITKLMEDSQQLVQEKKELSDKNKTLQETNKNRLEEINTEIENKEVKIRSIEHDLEELERELKYKKDLIEKFELSNAFVDNREELGRNKKKIEDNLASLTDSLNNFKYALDKNDKLKEQEEEELKAYDKKMYQLRKQLEYLSRSSGEEKLHPKMEAVEREIKNTKFKDSVVGPIGKYIKVKETKWAKVASIVTHKILTNFICFNGQDRDALHRIFKKVGVSFSVLMPSNRMNSLLEYSSNTKYKTLLDVLSISSTVVFNQLIILLSIERISLIESREKAYEVMRQSPQFVDAVYLPGGDVIKKIGGSLSDFSSKALEKYYFENETEKKKELQRQLETLRSNKPSNRATQESISLRQKVSDIHAEIESLTKEKVKLERELENAEDLLATQKKMLSNENLYEERRLIDTQIKILYKKTNKMREEIKSLNEEKVAIKNVVYKSYEDLDKSLFEKQTKLNRLNQEINNLIVKKLEIEKVYKNNIGDFECKRLALLETIKEVINPRDETFVSERLDKLKTEIDEINKIGNLNESHQHLELLKKSQSEKEAFLETFKTKVKELFCSFKDRVKKREDLKNFIAQKATSRFQEITLSRGYNGQLQFEHEKEELNIKMEVHSLGVAGSKETLSGGERSFAAMAFLLSLWPYVSCPVKVLDEFDVFMDNMNRKFIIEKFKEYFLNSQNQVILITPLNTNDLDDPSIEIIRLKTPERNETIEKLM